MRNGKPLFVWDLTPERLEGWTIQAGVHCLACTAGCGSSCAGALTDTPVATSAAKVSRFSSDKYVGNFEMRQWGINE